MSTVRINLLPWREERRKRQNIEFGVMAGAAAVLAALIALGVSVFFQGKVDYQNARNHYLESEIVVLNTKLKKIKELEKKRNDLEARMDVIDKLQSNRSVIVHLFQEILTALPDGVWLKNIKQTPQRVNISGFAESNARVSAFMRNLDDSLWIKLPNLISINATSEQSAKAEFNLDFAQETPSNEDSKK